ncbi:MAG: hypothetical protein QOE73_753 [Verrucomicrobiota bacterium]|jgi:hypothetical protein
MTSLKTQMEIRERVVALIVSHTGVLAQSVGRDSPIWDHFPTRTGRSGARESPTVTSFVQDVHSEFNVYLTEKEWEEPTPDSLAEDIRAKRENPAASVADWTHDRAALKKDAINFFLIMVILGPAILFFGTGPLITRLVIGLGLPLFAGVMVLGGYRNRIRKLDAAAPRQ